MKDSLAEVLINVPELSDAIDQTFRNTFVATTKRQVRIEDLRKNIETLQRELECTRDRYNSDIRVLRYLANSLNQAGKKDVYIGDQFSVSMDADPLQGVSRYARKLFAGRYDGPFEDEQ